MPKWSRTPRGDAGAKDHHNPLEPVEQNRVHLCSSARGGDDIPVGMALRPDARRSPPTSKVEEVVHTGNSGGRHIAEEATTVAAGVTGFGPKFGFGGG